MHSLYKWLLSSFANITLVGFVETATAGVIINVAESNGNVVATVSGSLAYLGLGTVNAPINTSGGAGIAVDFNGSDVLSAVTPGTYSTTSYAMTGPALAWGNSPSFAFTTNNFSLTGTNFFLFYTGQSIDIGTYNFGDPINATMTFENTTLVTLGLVNLGTYNYTVGSGLDIDTIRVNIGGAAVPEPSSLAVVSIGAVAAAIRARRKAKNKA